VKLLVFDHPLIRHKITRLRNKDTDPALFRLLVNEIASLMVYEATRDIPVEEVEIETPLTKTKGYIVCQESIAVIPILRAGLGMMEGIMNALPMARVGHIGLYRDHDTLKPVEYYCKLPEPLGSKFVIVADPMLATGGSCAEAISVLKSKGARKIVLCCIISAPEGVKYMEEKHPDVDIFTAAMDPKLNENGYIVPGLGDAGDRLFGTR
jgi:uracil phosphoribosyltransferase